MPTVAELDALGDGQQKPLPQTPMPGLSVVDLDALDQVPRGTEQPKGWYSGTVAPALTESVGKIFAAPGEALLQGLNAVGLRSDSPEAAAGGLRAAQAAGQGPASVVVPQTGWQAGATAATLPLMPARAALSTIPLIGKAAPALASVLAGTAGGAAGAAVEGDDPTMGALKGGGATAAGEVAGAVLPALLRTFPWMKGLINRQDTNRILGTVGEISPPLAGHRGPKGLQTLLEDAGLPALGAAKEQVTSQVESMLPGRVGASWDQFRAPKEIPMPSMGTRTKPLDPMKPSGVPFREALDEQSRIGDMLHGRRPLDPRYRDRDLGEAYATHRAELRSGLDQAGDPGARALYDAGQADYRRGRNLFDFLRDRGRTDTYGHTNITGLQRALKDPETAAELKEALGQERFDKLVKAVFRGADRLEVDQPVVGSGRLGGPLGDWLSGRRPGGGFFASLGPRVLLPNLGAKYVGQKPLSFPPALQQILDAASQRALGAAE